MKLESECNWPPRKVVPPPPYARGSVAATAAGGGTSGALSSSLTSPPLAVADLRLLHHFILVASEQIGQAVTGRIVWGDDVVKLGFNHHFLLRGILAVSALHLAVTTMDRQESDGADAASSGGTPGGGGGGGGVSSTSVVSDRENVAELLLQSAVHMDAALGEFRMLLQQSRAESSEQTYTAVFFLACLLTVHGFGSFRTQPDSDPIDAFIHCAGLIQGAKLMQLPTGWASLKTDDISAIVSLARRQRQAFIYQKPEIGLLRERICAMSLPSPRRGRRCRS
ncbi:hypothetical protein KEM52_003349 [Ascosphaera acerosa]|nr:hypothetical protein KEM52_003349 [Ascosphaera acerosa]